MCVFQPLCYNSVGHLGKWLLQYSKKGENFSILFFFSYQQASIKKAVIKRKSHSNSFPIFNLCCYRRQREKRGEEEAAVELLPFALLGRFNKRAGNLFFDENRAETIFTLFTGEEPCGNVGSHDHFEAGSCQATKSKLKI